MARTTIDIDDIVLRQLKQRRDREHRPLGVIVSELLASALEDDRSSTPPDFVWTTKSMGMRIDIDDKEAVWSLLDAR